MKNLLLFIGILSVLLVFSYIFSSKINDRIEKIEQQNKVLELKCDSLKCINDSIKFEMDAYTERIDSLKNMDKKLSADYNENQNQLKNLKKKYEKNSRIDNFTTPDIIKYFTDSL